MNAFQETHASSGQFSAERRRPAVEASMLRVAAEAARADDPTEVAERIAAGLVDECGAVAADVFLIDDDRRELQIAARRNAAAGAPTHMLLDAPSPEAAALRAHEVIRVPVASGAESLAVPLVSRGLMLGVLSATFAAQLEKEELVELRNLCDVFAACLARSAFRATLSEHERFERSLRATARRFRACFDQTCQLAWMLTADGTVVDVNAAALEFAGTAARDMLGRPLWDAARWVDGSDARGSLRRRVAKAARGASVRCEMGLRAEDGRTADVDLSLKPVNDEFGRMVFLLAEARDITDRKRAEAAREEFAAQVDRERNWLRTVIEHAPVGILLFERPEDGHVVMNPRAKELLGCASGEAHDPLRAIPMLLADGTQLLDDLLGGKVVLAGEFRTKAGAGRELTLLVSGAPIHDPDGLVTGAVVLCEDISALKGLERLREEWTSVIAHDLRQPLNAIQLHASRMARHYRRQTDRDIACNPAPAVDHILASTRLLERMISELWDMACFDAGQLSLKVATIDAAAITRTVLDRMAWSVGGHALKLCERDGALTVRVDPERFEQILWNLICNADKYGYPATDIVVGIERQGAEAVVSVTNEGDGIDEESRKTVFERFQRLSAARKHGIRGLGLGLYISKQLAEAHGGRIWVESIKGERTCFRFTVPLC